MSGISNIFTMYNCQDIIIIILVLAVLYLIYKTSGNNKTDHFTVSDDVKLAINEIYKADINAIRNLSNFATEIKNNNDSLTIPAKTTTVTDLISTGNLSLSGTLNIAKDTNASNINASSINASSINASTITNTKLCIGSTCIEENDLKKL
jgi:hypothetical protein